MIIQYCGNNVEVSSMTAAENYVLSLGGTRFTCEGIEYTYWLLTGWTRRDMKVGKRYNGWSKETVSFLVDILA